MLSKGSDIRNFGNAEVQPYRRWRRGGSTTQKNNSTGTDSLVLTLSLPDFMRLPTALSIVVVPNTDNEAREIFYSRCSKYIWSRALHYQERAAQRTILLGCVGSPRLVSTDDNSAAI